MVLVFMRSFGTRFAASVLVRHMRGDETSIVLAILAFTLEIFGDGFPEARIHDPVQGPSGRRGETPGYLVFTLGAGFETADAAFDAIFDALVVAGLEMQAVMLL